MTTRRHWTEKMGCICGWTTYSAVAEAKHRHNFPAYCKRPKAKKKPAKARVDRGTLGALDMD